MLVKKINLELNIIGSGRLRMPNRLRARRRSPLGAKGRRRDHARGHAGAGLCNGASGGAWLTVKREMLLAFGGFIWHENRHRDSQGSWGLETPPRES